MYMLSCKGNRLSTIFSSLLKSTCVQHAMCVHYQSYMYVYMYVVNPRALGDTLFLTLGVHAQRGL